MLLAVDAGQLNTWKGKRLSDVTLNGLYLSVVVNLHSLLVSHIHICYNVSE